MNRRGFVSNLGIVAGAVPLFHGGAINNEPPIQAPYQPDLPADVVAKDESYWKSIQQAFAVDRTIINLNNGGVCPSPKSVIQSLEEYWEYANKAPTYTMWRHLQPGIERIRDRLAGLFGCSNQEIALTRNASEALETVQLGLPLKAGDEVLTTELDYPRMLTTWDQRSRREGIVVKKITYPTPLHDPQEYINLIKKAVTPKTKVLHISHVCFVTGQILPVKELALWARERNIQTIVDGAHAFGHFPFTYSDLMCDYYGTSLHKWMYAPIGNGMLFVRKERIASVWPLMAATKEQENDIRKFEEIGTHQIAIKAAVGEALSFTESIGIDRKAARLRYLHSLWLQRLQAIPSFKLLTSTNEENHWAGLIFFNIDGLDVGKIGEYCMNKHRIFLTPVVYGGVTGIRVTPNVYTQRSDILFFADVLEQIARGKVTLPK